MVLNPATSLRQRRIKEWVHTSCRCGFSRTKWPDESGPKMLKIIIPAKHRSQVDSTP